MFEKGTLYGFLKFGCCSKSLIKPFPCLLSSLYEFSIVYECDNCDSNFDELSNVSIGAYASVDALAYCVIDLTGLRPNF